MRGSSPSSTFGESAANALHGLFYSLLVFANLYIWVRLTGRNFDQTYLIMGVLAFFVGLPVFKRFNVLESAPAHGVRPVVSSMTISWFMVVVALIMIVYFLKLSAFYSREVLLLWITTTPVVLVVSYHVLRRVLLHTLGHYREKQRAVVIFANDLSKRVVQNLNDNRASSLNVVGYFDDRTPRRTGGLGELAYLGTTEEATAYVKEYHLETVLIVHQIEGIKRVMPLMQALEDTTATVYFIPDRFGFDIVESKIGEFAGLPVLAASEPGFTGIDAILKRAFDVLFSGLVLLCISPIMLIIALAVKLSSPGPVFFAQHRYGIHGKKITVHKFRSMRVMENDAQVKQATRDDDRVTAVGGFLRRTSLDELPQFLDVLLGKMSVVGPRPHAVVHNEQYRGEIRRYMGRHKVRPGITGWAQINGLRGETETVEKMEKRIEYDLEYIRMWSLELDLKIILLTLVTVLRHKEAY